MVSTSQANRKAANEQVEQFENNETDSCPLLGEDEMPRNGAQPHRIRNVRRIDNGFLSPKRSLVQRICSRKNRFVQRVLVACRLADRSKDLMFKEEQRSTNIALERLTNIRSSFFANSQSIVGLSTAICCFTGNSARFYSGSQEVLTHVDVGGSKIHECSLVFSGQVEELVLTRIDHRLAELKHIHSLIEERAKLVLDVEYAKRTLAVEQQKGDVNRIAEREQALQNAQLECERTTRFITEQLKSVRPNQDMDVFGLLQEVP
ncbi:unnamed protein product [Peronospora belbahrii]|uniref:Uncharacterized protein n=1 Tax=Peronospora belbahrii TaxID=622444 RepID=A0ABN8CP70_9STRA|nr:unnamed protein product [Peronospora belbahrii]